MNNFLMGGVERSMLDILSRLDRNKFDVEIATVLGRGPLEGEFKALGFPIYSVGSGLNQDRKLFSKVLWVILAPLTLWRLVKIMKKIKPDLVLTSLYQADILGIWGAKIAGVKERVLIQTDVSKLSLVRGVLKRELSIKQSTQIIAPSMTVKNFMVSSWMTPESKIKIIYNGVDFKKFDLVRTTTDMSTIGIVGRLEKIKGPDIFAKAILELKNRYSIEPNILFVGDGSMLGELRKLIGNQIAKARFVGFVRNVQDWLPKIDLLVVPSRSEGFGLVLVEGLMSKCIVVASDIPAFREIIGNESSLLFSAGDYKALAKSLASILQHPQKQAALRGEIDEWINNKSNRFNIDETVKGYAALLG